MSSGTTNNTEAFDRTRIYETLNYKPEPPGYDQPISWTVQQQVAATNGIHYIDRLGLLKEYPVFEMPVEKVKQGIMLDIGNGWGRWLVAGANKGYIPVGIDIRLEFCQAARQTLKDLGKSGYSVVADLQNLPFKDGVFDLVWSFSVIQHTHRSRMEKCLAHVNRILKNTGYTFMEFPNRAGIRNRFGPVKHSSKGAEDINSWDVRYYSVAQYRELFLKYFGNFRYRNHSFIGIGVLREDLKYVSFKNKLLCLVSLAGSLLTRIIPGLKSISDSIYVKASRNPSGDHAAENTASVEKFLAAHRKNPADNLNLVHILRCPVSGGSLEVNADGSGLVSASAGLVFPVRNGIPILITSEATSI
jgi:hypothetical protein